MIKYLLFLLLFSAQCFGSTELRIDLPEKVLAGEVITATAEIIKIEGAANFSKLNNQTLDGTMFISKVGLIEKSSTSPNGKVELQFLLLKPIERMPLKSEDSSFIVYLTNTTVTPIKEIKEYILFDWSLPFKLPWWSYLVLALIILAIGVGFRLYPIWKKKKELELKRRLMWEALQNASSHADIMNIWNLRLDYFSQFPDLEKNFRSWEKNIYTVIFKPNITDDDKLKIQKSYQKFTSELPPRRDYGV